MQVQSTKPLTDEESIKQGIEIIKDAARQYSTKDNEKSWISFYNLIDTVSELYNGGNGSYCREVDSIFEQLRSKYFPVENLTYDKLQEIVAVMNS